MAGPAFTILACFLLGLGRSMATTTAETTTTQKPTAWANEMLTELSQFTGKQRSHDDYVDSFSQAAKYLLEQGFFAGEHKEVDDDFESEYNQPIENPYAA